MIAAHTKLGVRWLGKRNGVFDAHDPMGLRDTTCTAGENFLRGISCTTSYLSPTSYRINGITDASLGVIGFVFVRFAIFDDTSNSSDIE